VAASGDYFDIAEMVMIMDNYQLRFFTSTAGEGGLDLKSETGGFYDIKRNDEYRVPISKTAGKG